MAQLAMPVDGLPDEPLAAATEFHVRWLGPVRAALYPSRAGEDLVLIFPPAAHSHRAWRLAAIQELAREAAPKRVNGVVGDDPQAIEQATHWLAAAAGVTGQLIEVQAT